MDHLDVRVFSLTPDSLRRDASGVRHRSFFQGLTEAIRKASLPGAHSDSAFAFEEVYDADVQALTGPAEMSDATRLKDVYAVDDWYDDAADGGTHVWSSGAGLGVTAGV